MNGIQGCVYIVSRAADLSQANTRDAIRAAYKEANDQRASFVRAAGQRRSQEHKLSAYTYRTFDDNEQGAKALADECIGNGSVVFIDAEHLPTVRSLLIADSRAQGYGSQVLFYEGGDFKDLLALQGADLLSA